MQPTNPDNLLNLNRVFVYEIKASLLPAIAAQNGSIVQPLAAPLEQLRPEERKHLQTHRMPDLDILYCLRQLVEGELI